MRYNRSWKERQTKAVYKETTKNARKQTNEKGKERRGDTNDVGISKKTYI